MNRIGIILLVEDNPDDVDLTLRAFHTNNIRNPIMIARDGQEALSYLLAAGANAAHTPAAIPKLVLLDLKLPKIDGLEVLRRLRADRRTRRLPVVVLSSSNEKEDILAAYDLGANSFVRKPIHFSDLVQAIGVLGPYWLLLNEPPSASSRGEPGSRGSAAGSPAASTAPTGSQPGRTPQSPPV